MTIITENVPWPFYLEARKKLSAYFSLFKILAELKDLKNGNPNYDIAILQKLRGVVDWLS